MVCEKWCYGEKSISFLVIGYIEEKLSLYIQFFVSNQARKVGIAPFETKTTQIPPMTLRKSGKSKKKAEILDIGEEKILHMENDE